MDPEKAPDILIGYLICAEAWELVLDGLSSEEEDHPERVSRDPVVVLAQELLVDFEDVDDSGEGGPQVGLEDVLVGKYHRLATLEADYIDRMVLFDLFEFLDGGAQDLRRLEVIHLQEVLLELLPEVGIGDQVSDAALVVRAIADGGVDEVPFDGFAVGRDIRALTLYLVGLKDLLLAQKESEVQVDWLILLVLT